MMGKTLLVISLLFLLVLNSCSTMNTTKGVKDPVFIYKDGNLSIITERYEIVWSRGCIIGMKSKLSSGNEWTLSKESMRQTDLPSGIGSFYHNENAVKVHHTAISSNSLKKILPRFPFHYADSNSPVKCENISNGVRLTYRNLNGDISGVLTQELSVERESGDLIIKQSGTSNNAGVFGISFSILNLRPDIKFAVPYFGGQTFGGGINPNSMIGLAWPVFWSAGIVIGVIPEGGSFYVFADDPKLSPKYLKIYESKKGQGLSFEAGEESPYKDKKNVSICAWRFNVFEDPWTKAAKRYREWLKNTYDLKPRKERSPEWLKKVSLMWTGSPNMTEAERMKENIPAENVLIVNYGWAEGFNRNAPFYKPQR